MISPKRKLEDPKASEMTDKRQAILTQLIAILFVLALLFLNDWIQDQGPVTSWPVAESIARYGLTAIAIFLFVRYTFRNEDYANPS
jgi:hypothetical protein